MSVNCNLCSPVRSRALVYCNNGGLKHSSLLYSLQVLKQNSQSEHKWKVYSAVCQYLDSNLQEPSVGNNYGHGHYNRKLAKQVVNDTERIDERCTAYIKIIIQDNTVLIV